MEKSLPGAAVSGVVVSTFHVQRLAVAAHLVVAGFYRTCVIDAVLEHSPAEYVRHPTCPPSPRSWV
jgi:hypothetical protein